jgi:hypothetical protein
VGATDVVKSAGSGGYHINNRSEPVEEMARCETQLDILKEYVDTYTWTFRWLWLINLAAIAWGIYMRHYDLVAFATISAVVAILGIARTRRGTRLVEKAERICLPPQGESSPEV